MADYTTSNPTFTGVTYAGEVFAEVMASLVFNPNGLVDNRLVTPIDRTKFKSTIREADDTIVLQNPTDTFSANGTTGNVGEVNLEVFPMEFHKLFTLDDIQKTWFANELAQGEMNNYQNDQLVDLFVRGVYVPKLKMASDWLILRGKTGLDASVGSITATLSGFSGLYAQLNAGANVRKIGLSGRQEVVASVTKGTTTTLTFAAGANLTDKLEAGDIVSVRGTLGTGWTAMVSDYEVLEVIDDENIIIDYDSDALTSGNYTGDSAKIRFINAKNIVSVLKQHYQRIPEKVRREGAPLIVPPHVRDAWNFANAEANLNGGGYFTRDYSMKFVDRDMIVLDNAPANSIATWLQNRVFYGYDLAQEYSNINVQWQGHNLDFNYRLRGGMSYGIKITSKFQNEITLTTAES